MSKKIFTHNSKLWTDSLLFYFFILLLMSPVRADEIVDLRNGQTWKGKILKARSNEKWVVLQLSNGGIMRFPRNYIKIIEDQKLPPSPFTKNPPSENPIKSKKNSQNHHDSLKNSEEVPTQGQKVQKKSSIPQRQKKIQENIRIPIPEKSSNEGIEKLEFPLTRSPAPSFWSYLLVQPLLVRIFLGSVLALFVFTIFWKLIF